MATPELNDASSDYNEPEFYNDNYELIKAFAALCVPEDAEVVNSFTGNINLGGHKIIKHLPPEDNGDLVTLGYLQENYVPPTTIIDPDAANIDLQNAASDDWTGTDIEAVLEEAYPYFGNAYKTTDLSVDKQVVVKVPGGSPPPTVLGNSQMLVRLSGDIEAVDQTATGLGINFGGFTINTRYFKPADWYGSAGNHQLSGATCEFQNWNVNNFLYQAFFDVYTAPITDIPFGQVSETFTTTGTLTASYPLAQIHTAREITNTGRYPKFNFKIDASNTLYVRTAGNSHGMETAEVGQPQADFSTYAYAVCRIHWMSKVI
jgi:hypothetical protein